jgi:hypothetical protein
MRIRRMLIALLVVVAIVSTACTSSGDTTAPETTTTSFEFPDLEFGGGVLPGSVPELWPMPEQSVIGTTMIDGTRRLTEIVVTYPADVSDVAAYYTTNLPVLGFEVTSTSESGATVTIDFAGNGVNGTIVLASGGIDLTAGTIRMFHE